MSRPVDQRRIAARVVLLGPGDRVLLLRYAWPLSGRRFWTTPGGGLRPGETYEQAVRREIVEETGIAGIEVGPAVWQRKAEFDFGPRRLLVYERFFLARTTVVDLDPGVVAEHEREGILEHRWWAAAELLDPPDAIYPAGFPALLRRLLAEGPPPALVRLVELD